MFKNYLLVLFFIPAVINACPFYITNDSENPIIVTDGDQRVAVYIAPNEMRVIDPTITSQWKKILFNEKLNFYIPDEKQETFYLSWQLIEKYCVKDYETKNRFNLSDIINLHKNPTDRLKVKHIESIPFTGPHEH